MDRSSTKSSISKGSSENSSLGSDDSLTAAARRVVDRPELMAEIIRLLSFTDPAVLKQIEAAIEVAVQHRDAVLKAVQGSVGRFGRDFVAEGTPGDVSQINFAAGNQAVTEATGRSITDEELAAIPRISAHPHEPLAKQAERVLKRVGVPLLPYQIARLFEPFRTAKVITDAMRNKPGIFVRDASGRWELVEWNRRE